MKENEHENAAERTTADVPCRQRTITGVPGIRPDDPRLAMYPMAKAGERRLPAKVWAAGSCYHCGHLPDDPARPPKFCTECGVKFVPVEEQNATKGEG